MKNTTEYLKDLLYRKEEGFLIKYHFNQGVDMVLLDKLYDILEELKTDWKQKSEIPKSVIFYLLPIVPSLYRDLVLYSEKEEFYKYEEIIYNLDTAISMCVNPDINDVHFNTPLRHLRD